MQLRRGQALHAEKHPTALQAAAPKLVEHSDQGLSFPTDVPASIDVWWRSDGRARRRRRRRIQ